MRGFFVFDLEVNVKARLDISQRGANACLHPRQTDRSIAPTTAPPSWSTSVMVTARR